MKNWEKKLNNLKTTINIMTKKSEILFSIFISTINTSWLGFYLIFLLSLMSLMLDLIIKKEKLIKENIGISLRKLFL